MSTRGQVNLNYYQQKMKEIEEYDLDYDLRGRTGVCFQRGKEIIKLYYRPIIEEIKCDMSKYHSSNIGFPKYYIKKESKYYAEIMDYYPYKMIFYAFDEKNNKIDLLIKNYKLIYEEICKFPNIYMKDLDFFGNILYDEQKGFHLIDTTDWIDEEWSCTETINARMINKALFNAIKLYLYGDIDDMEFSHDISSLYNGIRTTNRGKELLEVLQGTLNNTYDFIAFLNAYKEVIKESYNNSIETTEEMKKYIKIMKNS